MLEPQELQEWATKNIKLAPEEWLQRNAKNVATILAKSPQRYRVYGPYWWAIKDALRQYSGAMAWFTGPGNDPVTKHRTWYGSLYLTMLAGLIYAEENLHHARPEHHYEFNGSWVPYTLVDWDLP